MIQEVKQANDIVDVVGGYLALRPVGGTFKGLCPFHDDSRPSFDVDPRRQRYRCWSCGKFGDVFSFIQELEHVNFREALEMLARRAGISLEKMSRFQQNPGRALMFEVIAWAERLYAAYLLDAPEAGEARRYLGERQLTGDTVRRWGLGFAPGQGHWLVQQAQQQQVSLELLEKVGLVGRRQEGKGWYDRFRDRIMFPIRDLRGRPVGFGGRILPGSPSADRAPKYYNSCDSPVFTKGQFLYGLDQARAGCEKAGHIAVVEGYTDVLMAHQMGIPQVVATMGTALNTRHVQQLQKLVPEVILVYDADAGGEAGVDRALELFVTHDVALRIATLPEGLDPCDLLVQQGPDSFRLALTNAQDVLEFKLNRVWQMENRAGVEGRRRAIEAILRILALAPEVARQSDQVKRELMITRIAQRSGLREETLWARIRELRDQRRLQSGNSRGSARQEESTATQSPSASEAAVEVPPSRQAPAQAHERQLVEILLAEPALVAVALAEVPSAEVQHPGLRLLVEGLYRLQAEGKTPTLDELRSRIDHPKLMAKALELQEVGLANKDRAGSLTQILARFRQKRSLLEQQELHNQLQAASDHESALELLRQLQNQLRG